MTWAFEPDPETALALARNIELNRLGNLVTVYQTALSDQDGTIAFTRGQDTTNHVADEHDRDVRIVAQTRLDSIIGQHQPIMIKVDVEGHEDAFLRGAVNTIKNSALKVIELESYGAASLTNLHNAGFERVFYDPRERALVAQPIAGSKSNDIFVRGPRLCRRAAAHRAGHPRFWTKLLGQRSASALPCAGGSGKDIQIGGFDLRAAGELAYAWVETILCGDQA